MLRGRLCVFVGFGHSYDTESRRPGFKYCSIDWERERESWYILHLIPFFHLLTQITHLFPSSICCIDTSWYILRACWVHGKSIGKMKESSFYGFFHCRCVWNKGINSKGMNSYVSFGTVSNPLLFGGKKHPRWADGIFPAALACGSRANQAHDDGCCSLQ